MCLCFVWCAFLCLAGCYVFDGLLFCCLFVFLVFGVRWFCGMCVLRDVFGELCLTCVCFYLCY